MSLFIASMQQNLIVRGWLKSKRGATNTTKPKRAANRRPPPVPSPVPSPLPSPLLPRVPKRNFSEPAVIPELQNDRKALFDDPTGITIKEDLDECSMHGLDPGEVFWTQKEHVKFWKHIERYGRNTIPKIAKKLPGKSVGDCVAHYYRTLLKREWKQEKIPEPPMDEVQVINTCER